MSVNKAILLGNVGKEPDIRDVNGVKVAQFTLATSEKGFTRKDGTQVPDKTEWHNIVCWRGLAEIVEKYVQKGAKLYIDGKITTRSWDDQQGQKRYITEVVADNLEMLGGSPQRPSEQQAVNNVYQPQQRPKAPWE